MTCSIMAEHYYAQCPVMLSAIFKLIMMDECDYTECHYAQCHYYESISAKDKATLHVRRLYVFVDKAACLLAMQYLETLLLCPLMNIY
jgi:hypothetical protein